MAKAIITITGDTVFPEEIDIGGCLGNISIAKIIQNAGKLNAGKLNTILTRYASRTYQQLYYLFPLCPIKQKISTMKMHRYVKQLLEDLETAAASGIIAIMLMAFVFHITRSEFSSAMFTLILAIIATFIAWGRFKKIPIAIKNR